MGSAVKSKSGGLAQQVIDSLRALAIMAITPPSVIIFWYTATQLKGDFGSLLNLFFEKGPIDFISTIAPIPDEITWTIIVSFISFEATLMIFMPGKRFLGPVTPKGNVPVYKANGLQSYFATLLVYGVLYYYDVISATLIYDQLGKIYVALTVGAFIFCWLLYIKGHLAPSSTDSGTLNNPIMDFYWGMELYPRIFNFDLKMFFNCRFGMMAWPVLIITYALKQYEDIGYVSDALLISVAIQLVYLTKFYYWETGYLWTLDIMHDRFGYYICWGVCSWVPSFYTSPALFWVAHPTDFLPQFGIWPTVIAILFGSYLVYTNWAIDQQRIYFRETKGEGKIWGQKPTNIVAKYTSEDGQTREGMLLTSGWWGVSRHINYTFELLATLSWAPPLQFTYILPYSYFFFLVVLLLHRTLRDEERMALKYKDFYQQYCNKVPYKMIPYVY